MTKKHRVRRWFGRLKGSDFIQSDNDSVDVFVHYSAKDSGAYAGLHEPVSTRGSSRRRRRRK